MAPLRTALLVVALCGAAMAQVPALGWCPDYIPMADFNMERYLGTWYEAERYFTVLEAGSRCVNTNYTKAVDGRVLVSNQITNRLTGIKRVVEGEIRNVVKGAESKLNVKYSTLPVAFETTYSVLDTDYDSYSVVWSCSSIGPLRAQNAWVMTRERLAPGTVLQQAYGVLDKYKISRTFFVKTDQADCAIAEAAAEEAQRKAAAEAAVGSVKSAAPVADPAPVAAPAAIPEAAAIPVAAAPAAIVPEPAVPALNVAQAAAAIPAEKSADPVAPVAAVAPVVPPVPAVPFVPIPIAHAEKVAADPVAPVVPAVPVAPAVPAVPFPAVPAVPVVAADPIPAAAPAEPAAPIAPAMPEKPILAEPIKTAEPAKAIVDAPKA